MVPEALTFARQLQDECLGVRVGRLHRIVARRYEQALRPIGLSLSQIEILSGLTLIGEPIAPSYLADQLAVERSTMSRNLALMRNRDLIATAETSANGRTQTITITRAGTRALAHAREAWTEAQQAVIDRLGPDTPAALDQWLAKLT